MFFLDTIKLRNIKGGIIYELEGRDKKYCNKGVQRF